MADCFDETFKVAIGGEGVARLCAIYQLVDDMMSMSFGPPVAYMSDFLVALSKTITNLAEMMHLKTALSTIIRHSNPMSLMPVHKENLLDTISNIGKLIDAQPHKHTTLWESNVSEHDFIVRG